MSSILSLKLSKKLTSIMSLYIIWVNEIIIYLVTNYINIISRFHLYLTIDCLKTKIYNVQIGVDHSAIICDSLATSTSITDMKNYEFLTICHTCTGK